MTKPIARSLLARLIDTEVNEVLAGLASPREAKRERYLDLTDDLTRRLSGPLSGFTSNPQWSKAEWDGLFQHRADAMEKLYLARISSNLTRPSADGAVLQLDCGRAFGLAAAYLSQRRL